MVLLPGRRGGRLVRCLIVAMGFFMTTEELVRQTAGQYGVPPDLAVAVAKKESGLNQSAVARPVKSGFSNLCRPRLPAWVSTRTISNQNIQGGIQFLKKMYDQFGDWGSALMAYNAGPGAVSSGKVPSSSQSYAAGILAAFTPEPTVEQIWAGQGTPIEAEIAGLSPSTTLLLIAAIVGIGLLIAGRE